MCQEAEVLQVYAEWAEAQGDLPLYEALIIRAGRPQDVIKYYKENRKYIFNINYCKYYYKFYTVNIILHLVMWDDAIRVCEEYLPQGARALREEAARAGAKPSHSNTSFSGLIDTDPESILRSAVEYTNKYLKIYFLTMF